MKKTLRILSATLIASMMLPLAGCNKKTGPAVIPTEDDFLDYIEDTLGASEYEDAVDQDEADVGIFYQSDEYFNPMKVKYKMGSSSLTLAQSYHPQPLAKMLSIFNSSNRGWENYDAESMTVYLRFKDDLTKAKKVKGQTAPFQEDTQSFTTAMLFTFADEDSAEECFEAMIENAVVDRTELYEKLLEEYEDINLVARHYPPYLIDEDAEIKDRKVYDLKDLPEDVYKLDKKNNEGHFCYHAEMTWPSLADIFKVKKDEPDWISYRQDTMNLSLYLKEDRILLVYHGDSYSQYGSNDLYPKDWKGTDFEKADALNKIYKKFSLQDPKNFKIDDDLKTQFSYIANFANSEMYIDAQELFVEGD